MIVYAILCTLTVAAGFGRHTYWLGPQASWAIEMSIIAFVPGIITVVTPKLAVACLLIRLLNPGRKQVWFLYTLTISCIIVYIMCAVFLWIQCSPSSLLWDPTAKGTCWDPSVFVNYCIFCGCKHTKTLSSAIPGMLICGSIFRVRGLVPCDLSSYYLVHATDQQKEKDWSILGAWLGYHVSLSPEHVLRSLTHFKCNHCRYMENHCPSRFVQPCGLYL